MCVAVSPCDSRVSMDTGDPAQQITDAVAAAIAEGRRQRRRPQSIWVFARGRCSGRADWRRRWCCNGARCDRVCNWYELTVVACNRTHTREIQLIFGVQYLTICTLFFRHQQVVN
jgi:hypothetical protein